VMHSPTRPVRAPARDLLAKENLRA
jgi:hypothetical protein